MAKNQKSKTKLLQKEEYCMPYLTTCNNTINKIYCVVRNPIKYNTETYI